MFLTRVNNSIFDGLLALLYPQACIVCQKSVESRQLGVVCANCWQQTRILTSADTLCWKCGAHSLGASSPDQKELIRCRRCDEHAYTAARACGSYEGALRAVVLALKREPHLPARLAELLIKTQALPPLNQATRVIPVPLHPQREKSRGFNQATAIASVIAAAASLPLDMASLIRTSHAEVHRAGLDARGRRDTVANAFHVRYPELIDGEKILLVDDVFTTGATVSACAEALREAGAREVFVLTIARPLRY
jgi:ComF family protein